MMKDLTNIAARVKHARISAGFKSHAALATRIGQGIQSIESGRTTRSRLLPDIAVATGRNIEWILTGKGAELFGATKVEDKAADYTVLSEAAREVGLAWQRLPLDRAETYRDLIFYEAVVNGLMPWLRKGKPASGTYETFERHVAEDFHRHRQQLSLFDTPTKAT